MRMPGGREECVCDRRCILSLKIVPNGRKDEILELGEMIRLRLKAPPVEGKANAHLVKLLAGWFHIPKNRVNLIRGEKSRDKSISVEGLSEEQAREILKEKVQI